MSIQVIKLKGKAFPQGESGTIQIGTVTTVAPDANAEVTNTGTSTNAILNFKIPKGDKGDTGSVENAYTKAETDAKFKNSSSESTTDGYSADYINKTYAAEAILCEVLSTRPPQDDYHGSYFTVNGFLEASKVGNNLSLTQDGSIKIGDNINSIEVIYQLNTATIGATGFIGTCVAKNNTNIEDSVRASKVQASVLDGKNQATTLISVTKNDIIDIRAYCPDKYGYIGGSAGDHSIIYVKKIN